MEVRLYTLVTAPTFFVIVHKVDVAAIIRSSAIVIFVIGAEAKRSIADLRKRARRAQKEEEAHNVIVPMLLISLSRVSLLQHSAACEN